MATCLYSNIPSPSSYLSSPPLLKSSTGGTLSAGTNGVTLYPNQGLVVLPMNVDLTCPDLPAVQNVGVSFSTSEYQLVSTYQTQINTTLAQLNTIQTNLNSMNTVYTELNTIVSQLSNSQSSPSSLTAINQIDPVVGSAIFTLTCFLPIFFYLLSSKIGVLLSLIKRGQ